MIPKQLRWLVPALLLFAISAKADTTANVYVDGSYSFADNGYGIPPYGGTLDGHSASFYCVDFSHQISGNTGWQATVTYLTSSTGWANTRLGNQTSYREITWLLTQMISATSQKMKAEFQWAIWSFSGGGNPYGTNSSLDANALKAVQNGFTGSGWEILTPAGSYGQEFLVQTPEPGTLGLLLAGLVLLLALKGGRLKQPA